MVVYKACGRRVGIVCRDDAGDDGGWCVECSEAEMRWRRSHSFEVVTTAADDGVMECVDGLDRVVDEVDAVLVTVGLSTLTNAVGLLDCELLELRGGFIELGVDVRRVVAVGWILPVLLRGGIIGLRVLILFEDVVCLLVSTMTTLGWLSVAASTALLAGLAFMVWRM